MTGRLIKYEFKSIIKYMLIVWIALPVSAIVMNLTNYDGAFYIEPENSQIANALITASVVLFAIIFAATIAVTALIIIMRFYKGVLGNEGYLVHTLPVKSWQIVTSKGLVAVITAIISMAVAFVSIFLTSRNVNLILTMKDITYEITGKSEYMIFTAELLLAGLAALIAAIYQIYASLCIGQLAKKHRLVFSVLAYIGISVVISIITNLFGEAGFMDLIFGTFYFTSFEDVLEVYGKLCLMVIGFSAIQIAVYHIASCFILKKHLNLE